MVTKNEGVPVRALPWWKSLLAIAAGLVVTLSVVEAGLWVAGVQPLLAERDPFQGFSRRMRVFRPAPERGVYETVPQALRHSFNRQEFRIRKPDGGFRLFTLGGSSAFGFPWGERTAFTHVLGDALAAGWPGRSVEAVNAAAMSYGSHRMRILAHELLDYQPDVLVLAEAHNEFVETRFYDRLLTRDQRLDGARGLLYRWRLYSLADHLADRLRPREAPAAEAPDLPALLGLDVDREQTTDNGNEEKRSVGARFEENLRAIVAAAQERRCRVVLCTMPSNLRDWKPNQSLFDRGRSPEERRAVRALLDEANGLAGGSEAGAAEAKLGEALRAAPEYAETHFRMGGLLESAGRWEEARDAYRRARDLDGAPSRALGAFNDTIRRVAAETGAILVDVEQVFEQAAPHGLVGFDLIEDYVHPKPRGHRLIALALWRALQEQGLLGPPRRPSDAEFWSAVGEAPEAAPEAAGSSGSESAAMLYNTALVLEHEGRAAEAMDKYRACLKLNPRHHAARLNLGRLLVVGGSPEQAEAELRQALELDPNDAPSLRGLGIILVRLHREAEAEPPLRRAAQLDPYTVASWSLLGDWLRRQGRLDEAVGAYRKALALGEEDPLSLNNLANALLAQGQLDEADRLFRKCLRVYPNNPRARAGLGQIAARRK